MKLLLTGDLHLGRSSTRIRSGPVSPQLRAVDAWNRIVDLAIGEGVSALILSGDLIDQDNCFLESIGPLEAGIRKLAAARIHVLAVAGNHDFQVLPRIADQIGSDCFRLLGRGGTWERVVISGPDGESLNVDGWSFPTRHLNYSPLDSYNLPPDQSRPAIGLVHGDLYDAGSTYGFLDIHKLRSTGLSGWLLGHIHKPELMDAARGSWILYPGSPQALSPAELGPHGVWFAEVNRGNVSAPVQTAVSSVRYEELEIKMSGVTTVEEAESHFYQCIRQRASAVHVSGSVGPAVLSFRVNLTGESDLSHAMDGVARRVLADLDVRIGGMTVQVEKVSNHTIAAVNLQEYAGTHTAPGTLADLLLRLDQDHGHFDDEELMALVTDAIRFVDRSRDFSAHLDARPADRELARKCIRMEARRLLSQLVAQIKEP